MRRNSQNESEIAEMRRLYEDEEWSLTEIANKFGITFGGVNFHLKTAGVKRRPTGARRRHQFDPERLKKLYILDGLPIYKIAAELKVSFDTVLSALKRHGIVRPGNRRVTEHHRNRHPKYAGMDDLKIGKSICIVPTGGKEPRRNFYSAARIRGIRVSVKRVDGGLMEVTRVA